MSGGDGYGDLISEYQESGGGGEYYHQFDANANSNAIIDDSCTVAQKYRYQAFGLPIPFGGGGDPDFGGSSLLWGGQKGYYFDADTQLYLLGAGTTGRWTTRRRASSSARIPPATPPGTPISSGMWGTTRSIWWIRMGMKIQGKRN